MRDSERESMMGRMEERERERDRERYWGGRHGRKRREEYLTKRMGFINLNPIWLTAYHLLNSSRISIDSRGQGFLMFVYYGVKDTVELLTSLEEFRDCIQSRWMNVFEAEIREAARKLEDVLDSHVLDQFLSQYEAESMRPAGDSQHPLLFSINLEGIEQDIDGFVQKMIEMEMVLNPWSKVEGEGSSGGGEIKSDICELTDQSEVRVTRTWVMSWFATKAASIFLGLKEEYIKELEKLLPEDEEDYEYASLFKSGFSRSESEYRFSKIKDELMIWWMNKAASIFVKDEEEEEEEDEQLDSPFPFPEDYDEDAVSSRTGYALNMSKTVVLTDVFFKIRNDLIEDVAGFRVSTIIGMAGIGKTFLAWKILQDPLISSKFECRIFVSIGQKYQSKQFMHAIVAQMPEGDKILIVGHGDLVEYLRETLKDKTYLIVFDDVWDRNIWRNLIGKIYEYRVGGWILVTTRINQVAISDGRKYQVPFLNKDESWDLLRRKIFGEKGCPRELEKAGRKIAENCEGLPLLIITIADLLFEAEKTCEYWSKIADNKTNSIFVAAYDQILEVVYPSYSHLPLHLKACFLYLGVFPQNDEIRVSKLINLWSADGFLGVSYRQLQEYVGNLLTEIVSNNVALENQWSYSSQTYSLHSVFWYLCKREAWKEKFLLVLNSYADVGVEGIESRRRLSIYKNIILIIKDVRNSIASMSSVRSLLCTGPYHQYQVSIFFSLCLLKVLDSLTIRFYEFPLDVLNLVQLQYLSLTCNENLPPSISRLWKLQSLILHQHLSIKSSVSQSYLPVQIWDLQELVYLQIVGRNLPDPPPGTVLANLLILLDVGAHTCTEHVLRHIPSLEKLRVQIELTPVAAAPLWFCDDISHLQELKSLQFSVANPELFVHRTFLPAPLFSGSFLNKLTLSGFGYPWEDMNTIAELPCLEVLKLKCYAFRGERWDVKEWEFQRLRYLSVEDTDLVQWTGVFRHVSYLTLKNCYKLQEVPKLSFPVMIQLEDCNPSAVTCAKQMTPDDCLFTVDYSWLDDEKHS